MNKLQIVCFQLQREGMPIRLLKTEDEVFRIHFRLFSYAKNEPFNSIFYIAKVAVDALSESLLEYQIKLEYYNFLREFIECENE